MIKILNVFLCDFVSQFCFHPFARRIYAESNILDKTQRLAHSVVGRTNVHKWRTIRHPTHARFKHMDAANKIRTKKGSRDVRMSGKHI